MFVDFSDISFWNRTTQPQRATCDHHFISLETILPGQEQNSFSMTLDVCSLRTLGFCGSHYTALLSVLLGLEEVTVTKLFYDFCPKRTRDKGE